MGGGAGLDELGLAAGCRGEIEELNANGFDGFRDGDGLEGLTERNKELSGGGFGFDEGALGLAPMSRFKDDGESCGLGLEVVAMEMGGKIATEFGEGVVYFVSIFGQTEGLCAAYQRAGVVGFD